MRDDKVVLAEGYGFADLENAVPATPQTVYPIGSLSKQFTAAAIMKLVEQDRVRLDDALTMYLPEFEDNAPPTLIRHLMRQTSGLPEYEDLPEIADIHRRGKMQPAQLELLPIVQLMGRQSRHFEPGEWWAYSNSNYLLLAALIEKVTGKSYEMYLRETFFEPLGLDSMHVCGLPESADRAVGYLVQNGTFTFYPLQRSMLDSGSGGLCASTMDIAIWMRALQGGKAITHQSFNEMTAVTSVGAGFTPPYGFGLSVIPAAGERTIWHTGVVAGFNSVLIYFPEHNVVIAAITNKRRAGVSSVGVALARAVMDLPEPTLDDKIVTEADLDRVVGTYDDHLFRIRVFPESGRLHVHISLMDVTLPLRYQGEGEFVTDEPPGFRLWFKPVGKRADHVVFEWSEIHSFGRRIESER
jgi:CubicO group peptidase (beta-lactamase class C family)